jgi:uncharacterized membrane protein YphA (DoxX/SURF4 family)
MRTTTDHSFFHQARTLLPFVMGISVAIFPSAALAHVKWFVDSSEEVNSIAPYSLTESWVIIWTVIVFMTLLGGVLLERKFPPRRSTRKRWSIPVLRFFQVAIGAWLLVSAYQGQIFAPVFMVDGIATEILRGVVVIAGILLLTGFLPSLSSMLLLIVYAAGIALFGWQEMIEHIHIVGLALAYWIVTSKPSQFMNRYAHLAVPLIRITLGIALIAPALSEKLLNPGLAQAFLLSHNWNFMELMGFNWFDDRLFILSAGMSELLLGLLFLLGILPRLAVAGIAMVFLTTAILLGPAEIFGHLAASVAAVIIAVYGGGRYTLSSVFRGGRRRSSTSSSSNTTSDADED